MTAIVVFALLSLPVVWYSRRSLVRPASHGFYRFFVFEAILALVVLNAPQWFTDPFVPRQLVSWVLLTVSIVPVVWAVVLLHRVGRAGPEEGSPLYAWERTDRLVTSGVFHYIRHPMYASLLYLAWGVFLKGVTVTTAILVVVASLAVLATARAEEAEDLVRFGEAYRDYMQRTRRFVPFLF